MIEPLEDHGWLACPLCSHLRTQQRELQSDVIKLPIPYCGRTGKWWISYRCSHGEDLGGPYESEEAARTAWNERMTALLAEHQRGCVLVGAAADRISAERCATP